MNLPSISIVTCCYNPDINIFEKSLKAIKNQSYPKKLIEHTVMDGGSTNGVETVVKKYNCKFEKRPDLLGHSMIRMCIGIKRSRNEIILFLEPDNIVQGKNWLRKMVQPFIDDSKIVGTFSMHNGFLKRMPLLTKYYALIGANDPTLYYLKKSEKLTWLDKKYNQGNVLINKKDYLIVNFNEKTLPTLGDNGHMVRRKLINKVISNPKFFLHTDAFYKMCLMGYTRYGVVKNSIIHYAGSDMLSNLTKRVKYKHQFYRMENHKRVYHVFSYQSKDDLYNLMKFIIYSLTLIQPLLISIMGYVKNREVAWFLHPVMCFGTVVAYSVSELRSLLRYVK